MKKNRLTRKDKSCFCAPCGKHPYRALQEVFSCYHLEDLLEEIERWKEVSLSCPRSVYADGRSRERLLSFCRGLVRLSEVLRMLYEQQPAAVKRQAALRLSADATALIKRSNRAVHLTDRERESPVLVLTGFFAAFSLPYSRLEIQDMLEAFVAYEGNLPLDCGYAVTLYKCLDNLLKAARALLRRKIETAVTPAVAVSRDSYPAPG